MPELDVLRGWAAVLMVFNHVGFAVLSPTAATQGSSGAVVFLGSFAPVLFFFATGFGAGLAPPARWNSVLDKVLLLLLADFLLTWRIEHTTPRLDFFGFIAISLVATRLVQATTRPMVVAGVAAAAVLGFRYVGGRAVDAGLEGYGVVRWLLGVTPHDAVSYPGGPWLFYPLIGLMLGMAWRACGGRMPLRAWASLGVVAIAFAVVGLVMAWLGESFHRWGSVAAGFFAASVVVLAVFAALSVLLVRYAPRVACALSLGGVAAFAVVPLHYAMVHALAATPGIPAGAFLVAAPAIAALSVALSRRFESFAAALGRPERRSMVSWLVIGLVAMVVAAMFLLAQRGHVLSALWLAAAAQLGVGLLFAWRVGPLMRAGRRD